MKISIRKRKRNFYVIIPITAAARSPRIETKSIFGQRRGEEEERKRREINASREVLEKR